MIFRQMPFESAMARLTSAAPRLREVQAEAGLASERDMEVFVETLIGFTLTEQDARTLVLALETKVEQVDFLGSDYEPGFSYEMRERRGAPWFDGWSAGEVVIAGQTSGASYDLYVIGVRKAADKIQMYVKLNSRKSERHARYYKDAWRWYVYIAPDLASDGLE